VVGNIDVLTAIFEMVEFQSKTLSSPKKYNKQNKFVSDWLISKKSSPLKPLGQMNRNLVGSTYGRFCIKFPQSRMKGEQHRLSGLSL
jgi:hypothetical protein